MTPGTTPPPETAQEPEHAPASPRWIRMGRWRRRLWAVLFAIFAFEIGAFLVVFPWTDSWSLNHLPSFFPTYQIAMQDSWDDPYFRAAISCLGLANIYIAIREVVRLIRIARQAT